MEEELGLGHGCKIRFLYVRSYELGGARASSSCMFGLVSLTMIVDLWYEVYIGGLCGSVDVWYEVWRVHASFAPAANWSQYIENLYI